MATTQCGPFTVHSILAQTFAMDAGALFGIIPRPLWEPQAGAPDSSNRLPLGAIAIIIEAGPKRILVDATLGWKMDPKFAAIHRWNPLAPDWNMLLEPVGLEPDSITDVVLTHLHFDHCGGATTGDPDHPLAFAQADHHVQQAQWDWSQSPSIRDRASYIPANLEPLSKSPRLLIHPDAAAATEALRRGLPPEVAQALEVRTFHGHTPGLQTLVLHGRVQGGGAPEARGVFTGIDLLPTRAHLKPVWLYAFDHHPLVTVEEKEAMLQEIVAKELLLIGGHEGGRWPEEPWCVAMRVQQGTKGFEVGSTWMVPHSSVGDTKDR